jgi:hypothetical protein
MRFQLLITLPFHLYHTCITLYCSTTVERETDCRVEKDDVYHDKNDKLQTSHGDHQGLSISTTYVTRVLKMMEAIGNMSRFADTMRILRTQTLPDFIKTLVDFIESLVERRMTRGRTLLTTLVHLSVSLASSIQLSIPDNSDQKPSYTDTYSHRYSHSLTNEHFQ